MKKIIFFFSYLIHYTVFSVKAIVQEGHVASYYNASKTLLFDYSKLTDLVIFGDSYSATGTDYADMTYNGENQSGGKNWPIHLIYIHDMYLWNFARSGAPLTNDYVLKKKKSQYPLDTQYELFKSKMTKDKEYSNWEGKSTLFAFWFGINDIIKTTKTRAETISEGLMHLVKVINDIYEEGARNYLFLNVPPFDKSPLVVEGEYKDKDFPIFIKEFNKGIAEKVDEFSVSHPEANVILYNSYDEFEYILENHDKYNITEIVKEYHDYPHKDPDTFYWNNSNHPSEKVHKYFTEDLHYYLNSISVTKVDISNSTIRASAHFKSGSLKKFSNELNHSILPLIVFLLFLVFF